MFSAKTNQTTKYLSAPDEKNRLINQATINTKKFKHAKSGGSIIAGYGTGVSGAAKY
jgi:hypothetical protein